ncbi:zinc finger protein 726 isoform X2 [Aethina tumida]|uniref:zinc finger protein 726 isoform X2 n=1 Tax=Aethina tumida TaxID=116153 RepID=UPI002148AEB3|nr:zinc finger protein 726 isoform X2 [Aethina tumida]
MEGQYTEVLRNMKLCRFCLTDEGELINIYERPNKDNKLSVPLPLQIMACTAIEVFSGDGMPQLLCTSCRNLTQLAYNFKTNAKKADDCLKLFLATGQLNKPQLKPVQPPGESELPSPDKNLGKFLKLANDSGQPKKVIKSEIITLSFDNNSGEQVSQSIEIQGEHDAEIDSMEVDMQEDSQESFHVQKESQVRSNIYSCTECDRSFPLKQLLDLHMINHNRERHFKCDQCDKKFFNKFDLKKHQTTHNDDRPYTCVVCEKTFNRETQLRRHEKVHYDAPKFNCTECQRVFLTKHHFDVHMEKHRKKRPFECKKCNKSFVFKQGLERHEAVHDENKPHKCNYCESSFSTAIKLTRHITTHAGLRPYPCKLCGRTFLLSHHLTRHMRSHYVSTPEKSIGEHKCDICSMSFRRKDFLINHSAIHSMVNLRCVICNTSFETADLVKAHISTHLSDLPFPCEKCDYSFNTQEQLEEHELKHAEMEYEVQIEQEVLAEAKQGEGEDSADLGDGSDYEHADVEEFTLTNDLDDPQIIRRNKPAFVEFLKDEADSDHERTDANFIEEDEDQEEIEEIKPIVRTEGTKVYTRKTNVQRKIPPTINPEQVGVAPLEQITQPELLDNLNVSQHPVTTTPTTTTTTPPETTSNVKAGMKVQKFILTKNEMKEMAKKGLLEMKDGKIILKTRSQSFVNATLKQITPNDLEAMIEKNQNPKTYQNKMAEAKRIENSMVSFNVDLNFGESASTE